MKPLRGLLNGVRGPRSRRERVAAAPPAPARREPARTPPGLPLAAGTCWFLLTVLFAGLLADAADTGFAGVVGALIVSGLLTGLFAAYLGLAHPDALRSRGRVALACAAVAFTLVLAALHAGFRDAWPPALLPLPAASMLLAVVFSRRFAFDVTAMLLLLCGMLMLLGGRMPREEAVEILTVLAAGGATACVFTGRIRTRGKVLTVGLLIGGAQALAFSALGLVGGGGAAPPVLHRVFWGLAHGVLTGFVLSGILPLVERVFRVSTDLSLLELGNIAQQRLLRRLLLSAPGTYNHSFVVGMLAEEAAEAVGVNPLLARIGGYYHDIGKILKPEYFGENEAVPGQRHLALSPTMSTLVIRAHVKDGVELARHHDLPRAVVDIIREHHGTTLVEFFYNEAKHRAAPGQAVEETAFRYEGPRPRTPEAGIVLLADSVEAATRSLVDPSPARVEAMVRKIVSAKLSDGQLDDCGLTLRDVRKIEESFVRVVAGIFHRRPRYDVRSTEASAPPPPSPAQEEA